MGRRYDDDDDDDDDGVFSYQTNPLNKKLIKFV